MVRVQAKRSETKRPPPPEDPPGDAPKTPWDTYEPQKRQCLKKYTAPEAFHWCVRTCLLGPIA